MPLGDLRELGVLKRVGHRFSLCLEGLLAIQDVLVASVLAHTPRIDWLGGSISEVFRVFFPAVFHNLLDPVLQGSSEGFQEIGVLFGRVWDAVDPFGVADQNQFRHPCLSLWYVPGVVAIGLGQFSRHLGDVRVMVLQFAVLVCLNLMVVYDPGRLVQSAPRAVDKSQR